MSFLSLEKFYWHNNKIVYSNTKKVKFIGMKVSLKYLYENFEKYPRKKVLQFLWCGFHFRETVFAIEDVF